MILLLDRYLIGVLKCHQTGKKRYSRLAIIHCAVPIAIVAPFQLRPEKNRFVITTGKKVPIVIPTGKKSSSRLSGGCKIAITTGKKSSSRLSGRCAIAITTGKKSSSRLSGRCAIIITTGKKKF